MGPDNQVGMGSMRNSAIFEDKFITATTDGRLVALDAKNGRKIWESPLGGPGTSYSTTSGPIVAKGKVIQGLQGCDDRMQAPRFALVVQGVLAPLESVGRFVHGPDICLKDDGLRRGGTNHCRAPLHGPGGDREWLPLPPWGHRPR